MDVTSSNTLITIKYRNQEEVFDAIIIDSKDICVHERIKYDCIDCELYHCKHKKYKYTCRRCGSNQCEHGKYKYDCKCCKANRKSAKK